jgi:hypothetical protein
MTGTLVGEWLQNDERCARVLGEFNYLLNQEVRLNPVCQPFYAPSKSLKKQVGE